VRRNDAKEGRRETQVRCCGKCELIEEAIGGRRRVEFRLVFTEERVAERSPMTSHDIDQVASAPPPRSCTCFIYPPNVSTVHQTIHFFSTQKIGNVLSSMQGEYFAFKDNLSRVVDDEGPRRIYTDAAKHSTIRGRLSSGSMNTRPPEDSHQPTLKT